VTWVDDHDVLASPVHEAGFDVARAFGPSVIEDANGVLWVWDSGHEGSINRTDSRRGSGRLDLGG
jgi:hypothetical protein